MEHFKWKLSGWKPKLSWRDKQNENISKIYIAEVSLPICSQIVVFQ